MNRLKFKTKLMKTIQLIYLSNKKRLSQKSDTKSPVVWGKISTKAEWEGSSQYIFYGYVFKSMHMT